MPNNDKVEKLYKTFVSEGYEMEPIDEFRKNLSDKNKRKAAYDALVKDGYDMEPYAEFEKNIGFGSVVAASVVNPTETTQPKAGEQPTPAEASGPVARMKELVAQNGTAIPQQPTLQMKVDAVNEETRRKKAEKENPPVIDYAGMMRSEQINMAPQRMEPVRMDVERKQEEQNLGTMFYPKEVKSEADVLDNYRARFAMTKRGNELNNELDAKGREVNERYMKEFEQTPEYKEIVGRKYRTKEEADEANQLLNDTFGRMYGKQIEQEMAPYYLAMQEEINDRYGFRIGEDVKALRKQTTSEQVKELATDVDGLIEKQRKSLRRHAGSGGNAMNVLMGSAQYMQATTEERKEMGALDAAKKLLEQSQNIIEAAGRRGDTNFMKELGIGVADNFDLENFTFGLAEMAGEKYLNNALEKADKGEELTAAEEKLLEASFINMATQTYFGSDLARGYKAGQVTAESLPFMMEFIANPIASSGNAIAKGLLKFGLKRFGNVATRKASKFAGRLLGDAAAALGMEATTGVPRVAAGTLQRLNEDYDYSLDENGDIQVKKAGDVSLAGALGRSVASTFIENQSEMIFNAFKVWKPFMKAADDALPGGVNELMARIKRSKPAQLYRALKDNKLFRDAVERAQFHGIGEEYLEEVYNNLSNVAMGEMTMDEALDLDNNIDTFLGLAPTSAAFGLIGLGGLAHERIRNRRNMERIFGRMNDDERSKLEELQRMAGERGNEDIREFIKETMADESLTQDQKRDEIAYAYELAKQTAMNEMEEAQAEDAAEASPEAAQAYAERKDAEERLKEENPQMYAMLKRYLESDASDSEIEQVLMDVGSQGGLRDLGQAYVDAYRRTKMAVMDVEESEKAQDAAVQIIGVQDAETISVQNRITAYCEEARRKAESDVQMLGNEDMGEVIEVETALGDGKTVFVTKGRLVFNEDGLVDPLESDDTIYYRDSDGNAHPTKPDMLTKLVNRTGFGEYVATAEYQAAERAMAEAEAENAAQPAEDAGMQPAGQEGTAAQPAAEPAAEKPVPRLEDGTVDYDSMLRDDPMAFYREYAREFGTEEANNALAAQRDGYYKQATQKEKQAAKEVSPGKRATLLREAKRLREEGKRFENMVAGWKQKEPKATQTAVSAEEQTASEAKPQGLIAEAEAEVQRQQEAIAGRTEEEQQAAQQAAQARIDAGVKATPKTRRYGEEESKLPPASTLRETVAREIATGRATFRWKDNGTTKGLGAHTTNSEEERRRLIWSLNNTEGELPEVVAERIHESLPDGMREQYTSMDVLNEILDLIQTYSSPTDMWAEEVRRPNAAMSDETQAEGYAENDARLRLEWEAEKNGMSVEDWQSYNEYVAEQMSNLPAQEEIDNEITLNVNKYGDRRTEREVPAVDAGQGTQAAGVDLGAGERSNPQGTAIERESGGAQAGLREGDAVVRQGDAEAGGTGGNLEKWSVDGSTTISPAKKQPADTENISALDHNINSETLEPTNSSTDVDSNLIGKQDDTATLQSSDVSTDKGITIPAEKQGNSGEKQAITGNIVQKRIEAARSEVEPHPTDAQKEAGNYRKGHVRVDGYDISIENPKGSTRSGVDAGGKPWSVTMNNDYGYIRGTKAVDGDHIDVFLSDNPNGGNVFVIDQLNENGEFDESKVMYGFYSADEAKAAYLANYSAGWADRVMAVTEVSKEEFKKWIDSSVRKTKPFSEYKSVKKEAAASSKPLVEDGTVLPNPDAGGEAVLKVIGSEVRDGKRRYLVAYTTSRDLADNNIFLGEKYESEERMADLIERGKKMNDNGLEDGEKELSLQSETNTESNERREVERLAGEGKEVNRADAAESVLRRGGNRASAQGKRGSWNLRSLLGDVLRRNQGGEAWIEDVRAITKKKIGHGGENEAYLSADGRSVIKVNDFSYMPEDSENFDSFFNRLESHNELFPSVPITVIGLTESSDGRLGVVTSQPYIKKARDAKQEEIDAFLEDMGFYTDMSGNWTDGVYEIADVKPGNVVVDENGVLHFIDAIPFDSRKPGKMLQVPKKRPAAKRPSPAAQQQGTVAEEKNASGNRLVTDERYAELRERMRRKLGGQMNMGIDPEILAIGTEMAVYHIEKGARKFMEYAKGMIADMGDAIRPYLKAFYNGARDLPEMAELSKEMTPYDEVARTDVSAIGNKAASMLDMAEQVAREQEVKVQAETAKKAIEKKKEELADSGWDVELVASSLPEDQEILRASRKKQPKKKSVPIGDLFAEEEKDALTDKQGNPIGEDGKLLVEDVTSVNEISDEDFTNPTRNIGLPPIPKNIDEAIGARGKQVVIKKNVLERNKERHSDVSPKDSRTIIKSALYNPDLYGQNQKAKRPYNWVVINTTDENGRNRLVLLEVNNNKDNVEIVHWHYIDNRGLEKIKRQAEHEDGQLLILPSESSEEVGALSDPMLSMSSADKGSKSAAKKQAEELKNEFFVEDRDGGVALMRQTVMPNGVPVVDARPVARARDARELLEIINNPANGFGKELDNVRKALAVEIDAMREKPAEKQKESGAESEGKDVSLQGRTAAMTDFADEVKRRMLDALEKGEKPFRSIVELRKLARECGMEVSDEGRTDILIQELVEDGLVKASRKLAGDARRKAVFSRAKSFFPVELFEKVCRLYDMQPTIGQRSSNRIKMQQYSTPLPMSFVADMFVDEKGKIVGDEMILEPTAGNGMLVFAVPAAKLHVNELDDVRYENLRLGGYGKVTKRDATQPFEDVRKYAGLISNPPFGRSEANLYDGTEIGGLEAQIALNALESLKDGGRAAIIVGGNMEYGPNGAIKGADRAFYSYLYDHYNVKGVVDMDGGLYRKQGTTYPTRLILIDGRRSDEERAQETVYPPVRDKALPKAKSFMELYDIVNGLLNSNEKTNGTAVLRREQGLGLDPEPRPRKGNDRPDHQQPQTDDRERGGVERRGNQLPGGQNQGRPAVLGERGQNPGDGGTGRGASETGTRGQRVDRGGVPATDNRRVEGRLPEQRGLGLAPEGAATSGELRATSDSAERKRSLTDEKTAYRPHSRAFSLESVAPAAMTDAMDDALRRIEAEVGDIDSFVQTELGYDSVDALHKALAAEQVDSVAMAIYQMSRGEAMIIGDQTGVGKGRQMAALIRWAVKKGKKPVFITQKADLFSDLYRDLVDIGSGDLRPFIFNQDGDIKDAKNQTVYKPLSSEKMKEVLRGDTLPEGYDFVVLTYSQLNKGDSQSKLEAEEQARKSGKRVQKKKGEGINVTSPKPDFLRKIAKGNILLLDESHTAAGDGNTGMYLQSIMRGAEAATFASATFAKRPDTMPLYAIRTAMSKANVEASKLIDIIEKGGVTLQEIMSRALSAVGQMVRRERDMSDVKTDWKTVDEPRTVERARRNYDSTVKAFNAIIKFQKEFVEPYIEELSAQLAIQNKSAEKTRGTKDMGLTNVPFASKAYNYTKQLLLALKVDAIVDEVDREIKAGRHPVIALESTMESVLDGYNAGDVLENATFGASLMKGLEGTLSYTVKDEKNKESKHKIPLEMLPASARQSYEEVKRLIMESTKEVFVSPIDDIISKLNQRGYSVGELTGRDKWVSMEDGRAVVRKRADKDKKRMTMDFNAGRTDVLILNKSASTGISLHASSRFSDQRQRTMVMAQPLSDINDYMQMIGRIDRTGQVHRGYYINLGLPVPAENRFMMMLSTKLKSLNANTTTSQDSKQNDVEAPDLLNKYGSQVVVEYLRDHPEVYGKMGDPLGLKEEKTLEEYVPQEDDARRVTGYVALLSVEEQDAFYNEVVERYNTLMTQLNETDSNDLKISVMPLKAKTLSRKVATQGNDSEGMNPFARDSYVEEVEMDVLRKPWKMAEVKKQYDALQRGVRPAERVQQMLSQLDSEATKRKEAENARHEDAMAGLDKEVELRTEKIRQQKKLSDEDKQKAIGEERQKLIDKMNTAHEKNLKAIDEQVNKIRTAMTRFSVGQPYLIPDTLGTDLFSCASPGMLVGFKVRSEGMTPSTSFAVFAVLDGRRKVDVKLSDAKTLETIYRHTMQNYDRAQMLTADNWDSQIPQTTRTRGYMLTGNIIQAVSDSQGREGGFAGKLVSYTDENGDIHDGILMPQAWTPKLMKNAGAPIHTALSRMERGEEVSSIDGEVSIRRRDRWSSYYALRVPKSKKQGGKYFLNEELLKLVDRDGFTQRGGSMMAYVDEEQLKQVLDVLSQMGVRVDSEQQDDGAEDVRFRLREEEAPKKTGIGYKVFVLKGGRLYPPMVANPNGADTPVGVWLDADAAPVAGESKTGRKQVKAGGKGTQGGSGQLAYRPGWHLGEIPYALQFNRKNPLTGEKELFPKDFVWAEVEYAADVDYQEKAMSYGYNANGKFQHSLAGLPELPVNGAYKYRTNPNPETDPWIITGAMKVKRLLKPSEVDELVREAGREPQPRQEGAVTDAQIEELNGLLLADGLEEVNRRFNERLEELMRDPNQKERTLHLGTPGRFLTDGGIANAEILLDFDKLVRKSREEYRNNHPFAVSDVRDLPVSINSPIAVFDNTNGKDSGRVILTELKKDGRNFIVAIRATEQKRKGGVVLEVNEITTLYPKEERGIVKWIIDGNATNIDKQKALRFIEALQPHVGTTITSEELSDATKVVENFENPKLEGKKMRDGEGVAMQRRFAERERERMRKQAVGMAEKLGISMEIVESTDGLEGAKRKAKGWYDVRTGRIVLVLTNHKSTADVMETVLHEAVAHYGLRRLFGEHFDDFLDNVFANAEPAVRREIADLAARHGWNVRVATEEYLALLAERTDFERAEKSGWMRQVRDFFMRMLAKAGIILPRPLGVNELRYILWRSYESLAHPGRFESPIGEAEDIARQYELKAGNYREEPRGDERAAEGEVRFRGPEAEEIQRELDNFIGKAKNAPSIHLVEGEESIDKLPIHPYFKRRIKEELDSPFFKGCYIEQDGAVVVIADRISSVKDLRATLSHESCHHASRSLMLTDKMKRAALKYLEEKYPKKYDELTSDYDESHWCEEALAKLFEIKADEYGLDKLLSSKFAGNNEIAKLFTQITNFLNYEQRGKTVRDRLGRSGYNAGTDSRREKDSKGDSKNQGESRAGYLGNRRENQAGRAGEAGIYARIDASKGLSSTPYRRALAAQQYEKRMASGFYQAQEALQDSMLSLRDAMLGILKAEGRGKMYIEDVDGFENAYLGENRLSSVNQAECELFATQLFRPLLEEFERIAGTEQEQNRLREYMMAKHGLERNAVMRQREQDELMARAQEAFAAYKKEHPKGKQELDDFVGELKMRDYAGLTGLMLEDDVLKAEEQARELVERYEKEHDTGELWKRTRAVNQAILKKHLDGGLLSQKDYEKISQMYEYYIPLRGFKEQTSDEAYAYLTHRESAFNAPIRKAEGRKSVADDPIATMQSMAESGILQANRNVLVKQKFLNFAMNHPSDLVSVSDLWIAYDEVKDEWVPQFPDDIQEDDTPEDVSRKMDAFEENMQKLAEKNPDKYKHGKEAVNIPYRVVNEQGKRQHQVVVKRGGRDYVVTVNGNPRLAQALNGESNPDNDMKGYIGKFMKGVDKVNRRLSVYYTTMNPDFVASNFVRDMLFANTMVWVKESPRYAAQFHTNFGKSNPVMMFSLLRKYRSGKLDESVAVEREFKEFMMNGGETGYAVLKKMEERKRDIEKELRKLGATIPVGLAMDELKRYLEDVNRAAELCARFAAYRTSRKLGRSVSRSIYDAKEISVNFNKKGSGSKFMDENGQTRLGSMAGFLSDLGRHSYVFWNAGVQGTFGNFGKQVIRHPVKSTLMTMATMFTLGALMAGMGGGGDDEGEMGYYDLPEGVRRSNIVFPIGDDKFCTLPLPVEFRTFYGLGELMMSVLGGHQKMDGGELGMAIAGQLTQLLPLNVLEGGNFAGNLVLSAGRPLVDAYILNRSWTGMPIAKDTPYNQYEPEWRRVYKSTSSQLVALSRWMNEMSGGGDHEKGLVDWNPAKLEYVLRQYLGGMYGFADRLVKTSEMALGQREWSANEMPIVNRLVRTADERTRFRAVNSLYYEYKDERDETRYRLRRYEEDMEMGRGDYSREIESIYGSPEYRRMVVFDEYDPSIREIERMKKETTDERIIEELTEQQNELKRELVGKMR